MVYVVDKPARVPGAFENAMEVVGIVAVCAMMFAFAWVFACATPSQSSAANDFTTEVR